MRDIPHPSQPSVYSVGAFFVKSRLRQAQRGVSNALSPLPLLTRGEVHDFPFILSESVTPLLTSPDPEERPLLLGKIENLRLACLELHHRVLFPGQIFSFWRQIGPPTKSRGFRVGREVREGCVIPTRGGGLCQLSGSLFEAIVPAGCEVLERHTHTALPADVPANPLRDATVYWNYVDLRFRTEFPFLVEALVTRDNLVVSLRGITPRSPRSISLRAFQPPALGSASAIQSCHSCDQIGCVRHNGAISNER